MIESVQMSVQMSVRFTSKEIRLEELIVKWFLNLSFANDSRTKAF